MNFIAWTADLLGKRRTKPCGCSYRRIDVPLAGVSEAWEIVSRCPEHGGEQ